MNLKQVFAFFVLVIIALNAFAQNYEYNRDGYVYVYAPNGNKEGSMNELVML